MAFINEATICTVSTPFHKRLLYYNYQLTRALNPGHTTPWIIVNNPEMHISRQRVRELLVQSGKPHNAKTYRRTLNEEQRRYYDRLKMHEYIPGERILSGIPPAEVMKKLPLTSPVEGESQLAFDYRKDKTLQSYHHAYNLEYALTKVKTRFAIVLDPDLYVVRPNWLPEILTRMETEQLAVFGVPWNPRYFQKYRYFPATHFMVIDFRKIPKRDVNLIPDLLGHIPSFDPTFWRTFSAMKWGDRLRHLMGNLPTAIREDIAQRHLIGKSRDSGYRFFEACQARLETRIETAAPVFAMTDAFIPPTVSTLQQNRLTAQFVRDERSYLPLKEDYLTGIGFKERGYPDFRGLGWEEFIWKDEPFAFHIRGEVHRARVRGVDRGLLLENLNTILNLQGIAPITSAPKTKSEDAVDYIQQ